MQRISLVDALTIRPGDRLACVGAGGKTTLVWRLWNELWNTGQSAIFTTTTHILEPILPPSSALMLASDPDAASIAGLLTKALGLVLAASRQTSLVEPFERNPVAPARPIKLNGLSREQIDRLSSKLDAVTWLIEADGARGQALKAPADHEPVIPTRANAVAVLTHLDSVGRPLNDTIAHRPERIAQHVHLQLGDRIAADHIARLLNDPSAGLKGVPAGARVMAVLNQRDATLHAAAASIAEALLASGRYERVVAVSLRAEHPVLEVFTA